MEQNQNGTNHTDKSVKTILERALLDKSSKIFLNKNVKTIQKHLKLNGIEISSSDIKSFLLTQKSAAQRSSLSSRRKIAEVSRSFTGRQSFFANVHSDICVLSKKRSYDSSEYMILILVEQLTNYIYLEKVKSTSFLHISSAFQRIFDRSLYLPQQCDTLLCDNGTEFTSLKFKDFMKSVGIKINYIQIRPIRGSKGSSIAERQIRRFRRHLEAALKEKTYREPLKNVLTTVENVMNSEPQKPLNNMSSIEALSHDPKYISMLKSSYRFKSRMYLKREMNETHKIDLYSIVKIKINKDKQMFEKKESYGSISSALFIVISVTNDDFVNHYKLGSLSFMQPFGNCSYTFNELIVVPVSYSRACYLECIHNIGPILKILPNDMMLYRTTHDDTIMIGSSDIKKK